MSNESADREAYWRENTRLDAQNAELRAEVERLRAALLLSQSQNYCTLCGAALEPKP